MYRFLVLERNVASREIAAAGDEIWIGRTREFPIALRDRWVSRRHALIRMRDGALYIEDQGSTTGTILNGRKIAPGRAVKLNDGDVIVCGLSSLVCRLSADEEGEGARGESADRLVAHANARLIALAKGAVRSWPIAAESVIVGRDVSCDIRLDEEGVAARHARIFFSGRGFYIENRSSKPPVIVNGRSVLVTRLPTNSAVVLGLAQILFLYDYEADGTPTEASVNALDGRQFRRYVARRARILPEQLRRLKRQRLPSNASLGEAAVRLGYLTPAFWRSLCEAAVDECGRVKDRWRWLRPFWRE